MTILERDIVGVDGITRLQRTANMVNDCRAMLAELNKTPISSILDRVQRESLFSFMEDLDQQVFDMQRQQPGEPYIRWDLRPVNHSD